MATITLELDEKQHGAFYIAENGVRLGQMVVSIKGSILTVYHTNIEPQAKGKGFGQQLFDNLLNYVAEHKLVVRPICPFVHAMFDKDPERYKDIWVKTA